MWEAGDGGVKAHPILFSTPMIQALLDGRKTMTRRVMQHQPRNEREKLALVISSTDKKMEGKHHWTDGGGISQPPYFICPYGQPGDLLWVRETWGIPSGPAEPAYRADKPDRPLADGEHWRPSIHMPRWASRLTLRVTDVRVERVQEITEVEAIAEGVSGCMPFLWEPDEPQNVSPNKMRFAGLWSLINAKRGYGWDANPFVWVISFDVIRDNIDSVIDNA